MTTLALTAFPLRLPALNWPRVSAFTGSVSLHLGLALALLIPPAAMEIRKAVVKSDPTFVTISATPPPALREPELPVPPLKRKALVVPPKPQITITAPIERALPEPVAAPVDTIAAPSPATTAPAAPSSGVGSDVAPSALAYDTRTPVPYPRDALRNHEQGTVILRVLVGADGSVEEIQIDQSSGSHRLDAAARDAVMKWKFKPGMREGVAYAAWAKVPIAFSLPL
jgi:protein TonB